LGVFANGKRSDPAFGRGLPRVRPMIHRTLCRRPRTSDRSTVPRSPGSMYSSWARHRSSGEPVAEEPRRPGV